MSKFPRKLVLGGVAAAVVLVSLYWHNESVNADPYGDNAARKDGLNASTSTDQNSDLDAQLRANNGGLSESDSHKGGNPHGSDPSSRGVDASMAFAAMAQDYKQLIKFPPYSAPLTEANHDLLNPYEFIPTKRPVDNDNQFSFELKLAKYVLFHGAPIPLTLTLNSNQNNPLPEVQNLKVELLSAGNTVATIPVTLSTNQPKQKVYTANFLPSAADASKWQTELFVKVTLKLAGKTETGLVESFQYVNPAAKITGVGAEKVVGAHLHIPLTLEVKQAGRYKMSANLFSVDGKPIAHNNGIFALAAGKEIATLRVHADTLRAQQATPPYVLKDVTLQRLPDVLGGDLTYGYAPADAQYVIKAFPLSQYALEKYVPEPELLEKAKFLEQLAQPPEDKRN
jgi:hypothetical protein